MIHPVSGIDAMAVFLGAISVVSAAVTHYPLTDPHNTRGWQHYEPLTDEFESSTLNSSKWMTKTGWAGRQPGLFDPTNIVTKDGELQLFARAAHRNASWPQGFDNFTTSALHSVDRTAQGYYEIRSRSGSSLISSSWWFHEHVDTTWTEIDVFESTGGVSPIFPTMNASSFCSHTHIFELAGVNQTDVPSKCGCTISPKDPLKVCSLGVCTPLDFDLKADFHVYGLEWNATNLTFYVDGTTMASFPAQCFQEKIGMDFDRETMPDWMGLPDASKLPDEPFRVDYVRAWKARPRSLLRQLTTD